jgi:DNA-binding transcriptional regulator GbsR (MarR family)
MDAATAQFVDDLAVILEGDGLPRVAGRIFGLLLLTEPALSLDELAESLMVSKASISINARMLEERGLIEGVSRAGDRRDYYRPAPDIFAQMMERRLTKWRRLHEIVGAARRDVSVDCGSVCARLDDFDAASKQVLDLITATLASWRARPRSSH